LIIEYVLSVIISHHTVFYCIKVMNMPRIHHTVSIRKTKIEDSASQLQSALFYPASQDSIHSLFAPLHYEPGYAYPLIVWLHGRGSDERQLRLIMPLVSMRNYVAVAPRGLCIENAVEGAKECYGWPHEGDHITRVEQHIFDSIEAASQRFHISKQRVFIGGFDCGGTMAYRIGLSHPQYFAGILSLCGTFPRGRTPFSNLPLARRLPILMSVGRDSQRYPADQVCEDLRLMYTAGMSVTLRQYPCGHELSPQMLTDVDRWVIEQITSGECVQPTA
jgi:phospholipase/carboxylesterase